MRAHIIMPLGSDRDAADKIATLRVVAQRIGVDIHIPTYDVAAPVFDLKSSLRDICQADVVVADLSGERPSCYYELGLAEALGKCVRIIAKHGTDIHQSAARSHAVFFGQDVTYENAVKAAITQGLERPEMLIRTNECSLHGSPIQERSSTFLGSHSAMLSADMAVAVLETDGSHVYAGINTFAMLGRPLEVAVDRNSIPAVLLPPSHLITHNA